MFNGWILVDFYNGNSTVVIKIYLFPLSQKLHTCWELWRRMFFCQDRLWDLISAFPTNYKQKTWDCEWRFINHPWWAQDWKRVPNILDSQCQKLNSPGKTEMRSRHPDCVWKLWSASCALRHLFVPHDVSTNSILEEKQRVRSWVPCSSSRDWLMVIGFEIRDYDVL